MKIRNVAVGACAAMFAGSAFGQAFTENFDDAVTLLAGSTGWAWQNLSSPIGLTNWFQGNLAVFPPQASAGYIGANFNNVASAGGTQSNWLFAPTRTLSNGDEFKFWARAADDGFPDRLSVRMSLNGSSVNVGTTATSVGDFTTELLVINPNLQNGVFLDQWVEFSVTLSGIATPTQGRIAFWYNLPNGGLAGANGDYIGIDEVSYTPASTCYPDCNLVGGLTIADFGCFQTRFVAGDPYADCNGVGGHTIADFGCFQTAFVAGCP